MSEPTSGGQARALQALRESEELHRATLSSISDAVFLTDDDGLFTFICPNIVRIACGEARRRGVTLCTGLGPSLPAIAADRVCLQQVMLNLMMNAMDAMNQLEAGERSVTVQTRRLNSAVEVAVSDIGHGTPPDRLPKLFDAFFTTKKEDLGLGLAIARSIVEAHGGRIWAEDQGGARRPVSSIASGLGHPLERDGKPVEPREVAWPAYRS